MSRKALNSGLKTGFDLILDSKPDVILDSILDSRLDSILNSRPDLILDLILISIPDSIGCKAKLKTGPNT